MESTMPQILSPSSSSSRRTSNASNSPEFEFWMARNPSFPEPNLYPADEFFVDGVIRPLHLLHHSDDPADPSPEIPCTTSLDPISDSVSVSEPSLCAESETPAMLTLSSPSSASTMLTSSKRWKDIFKKDSGGKNKEEEKGNEKEKKKELRAAAGGGIGTSAAAELNIYLWPFSRSRSAGTGGSRPRMVPTGSRKVSSAPCSRSNSAGESKSRKWPSIPSRGGVHLGRSSPVWQVRRNGSGRNTTDPLTRNAEKGIKKEVSDSRMSKPAAVGSGGKRGAGCCHHLSCRGCENSAISRATTAGGGQSGAGIGTGESGRGSNLFNFRSLFTKKVY